MESLEQLHKQLDNLNDLRTIVKTMKALSAASIRQYEHAVNAVTGYYHTVERGLHVVLKDMPQATKPRPASQQSARLAAVIFGSDHGLCGRFNEEIAEYSIERMNSTAAAPDNRLLLAVGARVAASLEHAGESIEEDFLVPGSANQITATVQQILLKVDEWRTESKIHYVFLFYNRHSGGKSYQPHAIELLPVNLSRFHRLQEERWPSRSLPTFTMQRKALLSRLLHQYLFVSIFRACAESQASEHTSRLAAMQSAQRNLDERLEEVTMTFRRARQNLITTELLDVVAGFEAISSQGDRFKQ
ncbi:MAG: F0F1 ATP synthase subunit gamma [Thioalkalispiraceae bacterium]|jgi:F-type H+-transporting ATPase subunit gamma